MIPYHTILRNAFNSEKYFNAQLFSFPLCSACIWTCGHVDMLTCGYVDMLTCGHVDMLTSK